ncbi:hypothetical protein CGGC5_v016478 [Colletotrichum fructicola Nara gc5]|uniref:Uncharacterized protein n=1 Tax=Colletotrichum fructicola (strain Nara gc5) TaxID=1213859 RepID=A0A7J6IF38_COLFN|nr:hypothetical protein CGGC5_v016478 [Colletotrichum fructicola Nara gc5]
MNRGLLDPPTAPRIIVGAIDRSSWRKCLLQVLPTVAGAAAAAAIAPPSRRSLLLQQVYPSRLASSQRVPPFPSPPINPDRFPTYAIRAITPRLP